MNSQKLQLLKCMICQRELPVLATHIIRSHKITPSEYKGRFPGSKMTTDEYRGKLSTTAKSRFEKNPYLRIQVASRTFDFIKNERLRVLLSRDYKTAKMCLKNTLWKPAIILYASLIEAILIEYTRKESFATALEKALKDKVVSETEFHQIHIVRDSRNFVHLHKELSVEGKGVINDYWAKTLSDICESLINRLRNEKNYKVELV